MNTKTKQKGFIQILIVILILVGLAVSIYLVLNRTSLRSKASLDQTRIEFIDETGQPVAETKTQKVKIRLVYIPKSSNIVSPTESPSVAPELPSPSASISPLAPIGANKDKLICHPKSSTDTMTVCIPAPSNVKGVAALLEYPTKFKIANEDRNNLNNAPIQDFIQDKTIDWELSPGEGLKKVYVQFGKGENSIIWEEPIFGEIILKAS